MPVLLISLLVGILVQYYLGTIMSPVVLLCLLLLVLIVFLRVPKKFASRNFSSVFIFLMFVIIGVGITQRQSRCSECPYNDSVSQVRLMVCQTHLSKGRYDMITREGRVVRVYMKNDSICPGDELLVSARLRPPCPYPSGGFPSRREQLALQGICTEVFVRDWKFTGRHTNLGLRQKAVIFRERLMDKIHQIGLSHEEESVLEALTLGEKTGLAPETREKFSAAGLSHLLALSGLHVGIVFIMITCLLKPLKRFSRGPALEIVASSILLWGFAFITGLGASVVRAVLMCMIYQLASIAGPRRPGRAVRTMVTAAFLMLLFNPLYAFNLGFKLSFAALAGILFFVPGISSYDDYWPGQSFLMTLRRKLKSSLAVTLAAQLATTPLTIHYFSVVPVTFLLTNILAAPLIPLVIFLTVVVLILSFLPVPLSWAGYILHLPLSALLSISDNLGFAFHTPEVGISTSLFIFIIIVMFIFRRRILTHARPLIACLSAILCVRVLSLVSAMPLREPEMTYDTHPWRPAVTLTDEAGKSHQFVKGCDKSHGLINVGGKHVLMLSDNWWNNKRTIKKLKIDVLYLCPGWYGSMDQINKLFEYDHVVRSAMK